ncbi:MAG: hypothetical protein P4L82_12245, partial [Ancalomicrobiaceae bacterium]|nr:hypothetical protein [Ancalomicrobiaceae bacterium]
QNTGLWGGCNVYASYTAGGSYSLVGQIVGAARMGLTTGALASYVQSQTGQTIDGTNTLAVSLLQSAGTLASGASADMTGLNTLCLVGSELIAYQTATLTGANAYSLSPMVRGAYGTTISAHPSGSTFARIDSEIFKLGFTQDRIGATVYLKFQSFNIYGGGVQDLSTLASYSYAITGAALASPLPTPTNLRTVFSSGVTHLYWDEVSDFRQIAYEIRKGSAWTSGLKVTTQAHPPFVVVGDDTYWVAAVSQPASGLIVYSASQPSIAISGSLLSQNLVAGYDEQATGWTGTLSSGAISSGANIALNGTVFTGTYEISPSHWVNIGYVASCLCGASYVGIGVPSDQNVLTATDFLGIADMLGSASTQFVDVHVEIAIAQSAPNVFATADIFSSGLPGNDIFGAGIVWSAWQKFIPGVYSGMLFKFRVVLTTLSLKAIPYCLGFSFQVTVPSRSDHYTQLSVPSTGLTITFRPDGASSAGAFNGGPNGATLPLVDVSYQPQTGDTYQVTGLSASQATISFFNSSGAAVARTADVIAYGY